MSSQNLYSKISLAIAAFLLLSVHPCWAQQDMGYITGLVTDESGGVLPGNEVRVVNIDTGVETITLTTETGNYTAGPLRIGTYQVSVAMAGFKRAVADNIAVHAQDRVRVDITLQLGEITETISVMSETPLLDSESATLSQTIETRDIAQLPLRGRNFQSLAMLSAGVIPAVGSRDWMGGFNSHGQRFLQNNFIIDGVDNNSYVMGLQDRKAQVMIPSLDAVQEFKVETSNYSSEFGRNSGAVMNVTVKGGTNDFHGSVYDYVRNDVFDARPTFNYIDRDGDGKADPDLLRRNQFGFSFGGPIAKNRTFFFGSWEALRIIHSQSMLATVPGPEEISGYFDPDLYGIIYDPTTKEPFLDNTIPQERMVSTALKLMALYPAPNTTETGTRQNYASGPPWTEDRDQIDTRIDHTFGDNDRIFGRFSKMRFNQRRESVLPLPARGAAGNNWGEDDNDAHTVAIGYTRSFSPNLVNEARIGYRRLKVDKKPLTEDDADQLNSQYDIRGVPTYSGVTGLTRFTFGGTFGFTGLGEANFAPNWKISEGYQYLDNLTWISGNHTFKFGGDVRFSRSDIYGARNAHGQFNFNGKYTKGAGGKGVSMADFLLGYTNTYMQSNLHTGNQSFRSLLFYFQDDWKVTPNLSLNLGARYELTSPWFDRYDNMNKIEIDPASPTFGEVTYAGQNGDSWSDRALVNTDTNNFAPRIGIAWRIGDKTVLRAGSGVFYGGQESLGASARMVVNWPFHIRKTLRGTSKVPALMLSDGVPPGFLDPGDVMPDGLDLSYWSTDWPLPMTYQWNVSLQRQLSSKTVLRLAYVGSSSLHIRDAFDINAPPPGDPDTEAERRLLPNAVAINYNSPFGHANYHGLDASLQKRYSDGFSFLVNYTWGKTIDNANEQFGPESGGQSQDYRNLNADRAVTGFDVGHAFTGSYIFEFPFGRGRRWFNDSGVTNAIFGGWQFSGTSILRGGLPFYPTLSSGSDYIGTRMGNWRPDTVDEGKLDNPTTQRWFDPSAYVRPCDANGENCRFGNTGRNILRQGGQVNFDMGLMKYFDVTETFRLQFRWEIFNAFNTPAFSAPNSNLDSKDVGKVTGTRNDPRIMQFALRLEF